MSSLLTAQQAYFIIVPPSLPVMSLIHHLLYFNDEVYHCYPIYNIMGASKNVLYFITYTISFLTSKIFKHLATAVHKQNTLKGCPNKFLIIRVPHYIETECINQYYFRTSFWKKNYWIMWIRTGLIWNTQYSLFVIKKQTHNKPSILTATRRRRGDGGAAAATKENTEQTTGTKSSLANGHSVQL